MSVEKGLPYTPEFAAIALDAWNACRKLLEAAGMDTVLGKVRVQGDMVHVQASNGRVSSVQITDELIAHAARVS